MASEPPPSTSSILDRIRFRRVAPTDIPRCLELEQASYPADEAASKSALQYRQHHAAPYFRCAVLVSTAAAAAAARKTLSNHNKTSSSINITTASGGNGGSGSTNNMTSGETTALPSVVSGSSNNNDDDIDDDKALIVGFICGTRCTEFGAASMRPGSHDPNGTVLAIHSVVVGEEYRRQGIARAMVQDYVQQMEYEERKLRLEATKNGLYDYYYYYSEPRIERLVLLSKQTLLSFYLQCGFAVMRPSDITHGSDVWYHCERTIPQYELSYWVVDSFAARSQPGSGNPAAIVLLTDEPKSSNSSHSSGGSGAGAGGNDNDKPLPRSKEWMQMVAREFNLSETAFCWPKPQEQLSPAMLESDNGAAAAIATIVPTNGERHRAGGVDEWNILYFTPQVEVALCGHATLAAAHVIASTVNSNTKSENPRQENTMIFHATNDILKTTVTVDGVHDSIVTMEFPAIPPQPCSEDGADRLAFVNMMQAAFGIDAADILYIGLTPGLGDVLVEVTKECFFQIGYIGLKLGALDQDIADYTRGVIVCCCDPPAPPSTTESNSDEEPRRSGASTTSSNSHSGTAAVDFWSRFFAPKAGIAEDPVTGSAHCALAPYFCQKLNKPRVVGKQMSARTGVVKCIWKPEDPIVQITGNAVTMMQGNLRF